MLGRLSGNVGFVAQSPDDLSPVGDRSSVANQIHIATVRRLVGIGSVETHTVGLFIVDLADAGLAQIIPCSPGEIADDVGIFLNQLPVLIQILRIGLGSHNDTVRIFLAVLLIAVSRVVVTDHIYLGSGLRDGVSRHIAGDQGSHHVSQTGHHAVDLADFRILALSRSRHHLRQTIHDTEHQIQAVGHKAGVVQLTDLVRQLLAPLGIKFVPCLGNLISDGVENHTGMIVVFSHKVGNVMLPPLCHVRAVIKVHLGGGPHIRELIHHIHTQLVAGLQKPSAHGIVGAADRVVSGLLQGLYTELRRMGEFCCSRHTVVVVDTAAPQVDHLAVYAETMFSVQLKGADTKGSDLLIHRILALADIGAISVKIGMILVPERRILHINFLLIGLFRVLLGGNGHLIGSHHISIRVHQLCHQHDISHTDAGVLDGRSYPNDGLAILHFLRGELYAIGDQMQPVGDHQIHIAVDTAAGVPAAAGHAVLHDNLDIVGLCEAHISGSVNIEVAISVRAFPRVGSVDIHESILVYTLKLQPDVLIRVLRIQGKGLGVVVALLPEKSVAAAARLVGISGHSHRCVVGKRNRLLVRSSSACQGFQ